MESKVNQVARQLMVIKQRMREPRHKHLISATARNVLGRKKPETTQSDRDKPAKGHGRKVEIVDCFPEDRAHLIEQLGKVQHNDAIAKDRRMLDDERLASHQPHKRPGDGRSAHPNCPTLTIL